MTGSLAYRKNEAAITRGEVPGKYTRLLPFITDHRVLEIGSAEGVLAMLLAKAGKHVIALEKSEERHHSALKLYSEWRAREEGFASPEFVNGDIRDHLGLLGKVDTLVAVRMVYYLRTDIDKVFAAAAKTVPTVVLCGNRNRADRYRAGMPDEPLGPFNFYASREGMRDLLVRHGYAITVEVTEGDEIIVGRQD